MEYLVLNYLDNERNLKICDDSTILKRDPQSLTISKHFLSSHTKKTRRFRSAFTTEQIQYLEREYQKFPYIGSGNRKDVSSILNIPERAVKIWFQNRRMKEKKESTIKETAEEEQIKNYIPDRGHSNLQTFNHQSHSSQPYTACESKFKTIYPDPSLTKDSIKHLNSNANLFVSNASTKTIQDKPQDTVKKINNRNYTETNNPRPINKMSQDASRQLNNRKYVPMKLQNKNICTPKLPTEEMPVNQKEHVVVKQEKQDSTLESRSTQAIHHNFYQVKSNQDHRFMSLQVQTLPQPPFVPGNILWKPVNMVPVVPGIATPPPQAHNNSFALMRPNFPKEDCKCNCSPHTSQESPLLQMDRRFLQSQYILAMPYNHCN